MRIVGGRWAGTDLTSPGGRVRPTGEALRVAYMELLGDAIRGARVLDLFSGTGALGLEALSRGAASVDFVENGPPALHALKANVARLPVRNRTRIFKRDAVPFVEALERDAYDVALADPPYASRLPERIVRAWRAIPFAAVLVVEHAADRDPPRGGRTRTFGDSALTLYEAGGSRS
ncbi:MAG: RsmD family RNA methyltransferase [Gemmatimonadetes bacterium]|nr:RsmD family RNA methyltransferase [Gemmatimonadota bacterium]